MELFDRQKGKISRYLYGRATTGVVERGIDGALLGRVLEYSRVGDTIQGVVAEDAPQGPTCSVRLELAGAAEITPYCSCGASDDQWCEHAVSLLWRAADLGFLDSTAGMSNDETTSTVRSRSPEELAAVLLEAGGLLRVSQPDVAYTPDVILLLDLSGDKIGLQVHFDGVIQSPSLVRQRSTRVLDNLLIQLLDEHGSWDEDKSLWYVSSSSDVETLIGFVQEYDAVREMEAGQSVSFARKQLSIQVQLRWLPDGAELSLFWRLPDGSLVVKETDLIGTGPYWTFVDGVVYRVSSVASRLAVFFTHGGMIALARSGVGAILETLQSLGLGSALIKVLNPELQPESVVTIPTPVVELERRQPNNEQSVGTESFEVVANIGFEYPLPENPHAVSLPNRQFENGCVEHLKKAGFQTVEGMDRRFRVSGDGALDLMRTGRTLFPPEWTVNGFETIARGVRFANLGLSISISSATDKSSDSGKIDWFDCHVSLQQNNANIPLSALFRNVHSDNDRWVRLDSGAYAKIPGGGLHSLRTTLGLLDPNFRLSNTIKSKLTSAQALSFGAMQQDETSLSVDTRLKGLIRRFNEFSTVELVKPTKKFVGKLRIYQEEGLSWLSFLHEFEFGGILADEMGLGKTIQALAFLQKIKSKRSQSKAESLPALVIAPTSVLMNWFYEARKFTPDLKVMILHGPARKTNFSKIPECDIVITSYALLRLDRMDLERQNFSYVLLDEAQNIKNPDAAVTKAAKALRCYRRLALTGTPTENRPMELWSIIDFLMPGYLGSYEFFKNYIEKPILEDGPSAEVTKFLRAKTKPFILRRQKAEVEKELPPKIESTVHVEMTTPQKRLYNQILEEVRPRVFESVDRGGIRGASISILAALLRLRQVCNHPNSIDSLKHVPGYDSGKFNALKELLVEALESGKKILIFAQFREMLAIIRRWLEESAIEYCYLDGETRNRQDVVDLFNQDVAKRIFLISLKAGGTGLNLASADTVIIYDPWWNPAVESQAVDRAHRIGQTKTVNVYRMVTEESIEQKIMDLKARKARIVDALVNENALSTRALSRADLEQLFAPMPMDT